jgi:hypothetical protein
MSSMDFIGGGTELLVAKSIQEWSLWWTILLIVSYKRFVISDFDKNHP